MLRKTHLFVLWRLSLPPSSGRVRNCAVELQLAELVELLLLARKVQLPVCLQTDRQKFPTQTPRTRRSSGPVRRSEQSEREGMIYLAQLVRGRFSFLNNYSHDFTNNASAIWLKRNSFLTRPKLPTVEGSAAKFSALVTAVIAAG